VGFFFCNTIISLKDSQQHPFHGHLHIPAVLIAKKNSKGFSQYLAETSDTWTVPKVMRIIFLRSAVGPGKDSGSRGRWRGNPGIQFDLAQLSLRLCSSRYVSKVRSCFCVLSRAKMQRSVEQR